MTNSQPTSDEHERLKQIRERLASYDAYFPSDSDLWPAALRHSIEDNRFLLSLLDSQAARPRHYFCSCGGALTAEEYIVHYFELGHDRGVPVFAESAVAAPQGDAYKRASQLVHLWVVDRRLRPPQRYVEEQDTRILKEWIAQALTDWAASRPKCDLCSHEFCRECDTWCCKCGDGKVPRSSPVAPSLPEQERERLEILDIISCLAVDLDSPLEAEAIDVLKQARSRLAATPSTATSAARGCAAELERDNWLLSDITQDERDQVAAIISKHFAVSVEEQKD